MRGVVVTVSLLAVPVAAVFGAHNIRLLEGRTAKEIECGLEQKKVSISGAKRWCSEYREL